MKITCATSIIKKDLPKKEYLKSLIEEENDFNEPIFEETLLEKQIHRQYCVSDLYVGYNTDKVKRDGKWFKRRDTELPGNVYNDISQDKKNELMWLLLHRKGDLSSYEYPLEPKSMNIKIEEEGKLIILENKSSLDDIKEIRIRFIRAKPEKYMSPEENELYRKLCEDIEGYAKGDPNRRETCPLFQQEFLDADQLTEEQKRKERKARNQKINDLKFAINYFCKKTGFSEWNTRDIESSLKRVQSLLILPKNKRKMIFEYDNNKDYIKYYFSKIKLPSFKDCEELKINNIPLSTFDERWFEPIYLTSLSLVNLDFFAKMNSDDWNRFAEGLSKLKYLIDFDLKGNKLKIVPSVVLENLPSDRIVSLEFSNNELTKLPVTISRLKKLAFLNISENPDFCDDDEFWNSLPRNISDLYMDNTAVERIPEIIREFTDLHSISLDNCKKLKSIAWEDLPICSFCAEGKINPPPSTPCFKLSSNLKTAIYFKFHNVDWPDFDFTYLPLDVNSLEFTNSTVTPHRRLKNFRKMQYLEFTDCKLTTFDFCSLPRNTNILRLGKNLITEVNIPIDEQWNWRLVEQVTTYITQEFYCPSPIMKSKDEKQKEKILKAVYGDESPPDEDLEIFNTEYLALIDQEKPDIERLSLSYNKISKFGGNCAFFKSLVLLNLIHNELESLPEDFDEISNLEELHLGNNKLKSLPKNLRKLRFLKYLYIQNNQFTYEDNLMETLWGNLPIPLTDLDISGNYIKVLPCSLQHFSCMYIKAVKCGLTWICPKLRHWFVLDDNNNLTHLPFLPHTAYDPTGADRSKALSSGYEPEKSKPYIPMIDSQKIRFITLESIPTKASKPNLLFKECKIENAECSCCANLCCRNEDKENKKSVEQIVVMDFSYLAREDTKEDEEDIVRFSLLPGRWKSVIRTILCESCIPEVKKRLENVKVIASEKRKEKKRKIEKENKKRVKKTKKDFNEIEVTNDDCNQQLYNCNQRVQEGPINTDQIVRTQHPDPDIPGPSGVTQPPTQVFEPTSYQLPLQGVLPEQPVHSLPQNPYYPSHQSPNYLPPNYPVQQHPFQEPPFGYQPFVHPPPQNLHYPPHQPSNYPPSNQPFDYSYEQVHYIDPYYSEYPPNNDQEYYRSL